MDLVCFNLKRTCSALPQHCHNVIYGNDANQALLGIYDGQGQEIIFVEQLGNAILRFVDINKEQRLRCKIPERRIARSKEQLAQGNGKTQQALAVDQEERMEILNDLLIFL